MKHIQLTISPMILRRVRKLTTKAPPLFITTHSAAHLVRTLQTLINENFITQL